MIHIHTTSLPAGRIIINKDNPDVIISTWANIWEMNDINLMKYSNARGIIVIKESIQIWSLTITYQDMVLKIIRERISSCLEISASSVEDYQRIITMLALYK